jgi:hypothetical protein
MYCTTWLEYFMQALVVHVLGVELPFFTVIPAALLDSLAALD